MRVATRMKTYDESLIEEERERKSQGHESRDTHDSHDRGGGGV
jgi:hypothetical protein